jgi:hypothetical protein
VPVKVTAIGRAASPEQCAAAVARMRQALEGSLDYARNASNIPLRREKIRSRSQQAAQPDNLARFPLAPSIQTVVKELKLAMEHAEKALDAAEVAFGEDSRITELVRFNYAELVCDVDDIETGAYKFDEEGELVL